MLVGNDLPALTSIHGHGDYEGVRAADSFVGLFGIAVCGHEVTNDSLDGKRLFNE
jgi:hypothetical protein